MWGNVFLLLLTVGQEQNLHEMQAENLKSTDSELELELGCPAPSGRDGRHLEWERGNSSYSA